MIARKAWAIFFDAFILSNRPILNALAEYKFTEHKVTATTRDCPYGQPQGIAPTGNYKGLPLRATTRDCPYGQTHRFALVKLFTGRRYAMPLSPAQERGQPQGIAPTGGL
ncbi:MAG: hypothetical protein DRR00_07285 [Candidatus Parabeggiatoa sp. nov. 3]|nr:MAG: hypothetical protein DRR00_07285 [Gammaproteobacteria bacterium]RKZ57076.1 MAG: hypothetical protein DRQ99_27525 [Gammaproteobacteria bacterium]